MLATGLANQTTYQDLAVTPGGIYAAVKLPSLLSGGIQYGRQLNLQHDQPDDPGCDPGRPDQRTVRHRMPWQPGSRAKLTEATQLNNPRRVSLTWTNPANITGLTLNRNGWAAAVNLNATTTSTIDSAVTNSNTCTYTLFGKNAAGNGSAIVTITVTTTSVIMIWQDNQRAQPESGYSIERSLNGTTWRVVGTLGTHVTTFTANGLTTKTRDFFRVRAFTTAGTTTVYSNYSNTITVTTL